MEDAYFHKISFFESQSSLIPSSKILPVTAHHPSSPLLRLIRPTVSSTVSLMVPRVPLPAIRLIARVDKIPPQSPGDGNTAHISVQPIGAPKEQGTTPDQVPRGTILATN